MIIIPDKTKVVYLVDSHPDTPEDAEYMEVSECDTIEIADKEEWNIIYQGYNATYRIGFSRWADWNLYWVQYPFSQYLEDLIKLKIAEKEKK